MEGKKKPISKNLKSKTPRLLVFSTVSSIPELLGAPGKQRKGLAQFLCCFPGDTAQGTTSEEKPEVQRVGKPWLGRKDWEWQGGTPYLVQVLSFPSDPTLSLGYRWLGSQSSVSLKAEADNSLARHRELPAGGLKSQVPFPSKSGV